MDDPVGFRRPILVALAASDDYQGERAGGASVQPFHLIAEGALSLVLPVEVIDCQFDEFGIIEP